MMEANLSLPPVLTEAHFLPGAAVLHEETWAALLNPPCVESVRVVLLDSTR